MKPNFFILLFLLLSCRGQEKQIGIDSSKHEGLVPLEFNAPFEVLFSEGYQDHAKAQASLVAEAYTYLSGIMDEKKEFCLLVVAEKDWEKNAYAPVPGMPEYYKGNLIVGAGHNSMASFYEEMIRSFPEEMTADLIKTYTNDQGALDMRLFFDKLSIHELTHNFQDPENREGYSVSRWLEELHANAGLYAFYDDQRPEELKYILQLVDFSLENPPPELKYTSLPDFDAHYYEMSPSDYGNYQMKFTKLAQKLVDSLGTGILKPMKNFLVRHDESWKEKLSPEDLKKKLEVEIDPYLVELIDNW